MQQKTISSVRVWSVIVGILSLSSLLTLRVYPVASTTGVFSVIAIALGLAVAYAGVQAAHMSLKTVAMIFWAKFAWLVIDLLLSFVGKELSATRLIIIVAQGAIVWYLLACLKKLDMAASQQQPGSTPS